MKWHWIRSPSWHFGQLQTSQLLNHPVRCIADSCVECCGKEGMLQGRALGPAGNQGHTFSSASCLFQDPTWQMQLIRAQLRQSQYSMVFTGSEVTVAPLLLTLGFWEASLLRERGQVLWDSSAVTAAVSTADMLFASNISPSGCRNKKF